MSCTSVWPPQALKNPTHIPHSNFDVPTPQNLYTLSSPPPLTKIHVLHFSLAFLKSPSSAFPIFVLTNTISILAAPPVISQTTSLT